MPIPPLNAYGLLPVGVHECTLAEIKDRFGCFLTSDRRPRLFEKLRVFFDESMACGLVVGVIVDGSFVTAALEPNDIDLIVELKTKHDFSADIPIGAYNVLSKQRVRRRFGFDLLLARADSPEAYQWVDFFQQVRLAPELRKGILRVRI